MLIIQMIMIQGVAFVVLIFFLQKMLFASSSKETRRLQDLNIENTKRAKELSEKLEQAKRDYREKMLAADAEVKRLKQAARQEIEQLKQVAVIEGKQEKERLVEQAIKSKEMMRDEIERTYKTKAIEFAAEIIKDLLSFKNQELMHNRFLEEIFVELEGVDADALRMKDVDESTFIVKTAFKINGAQRNKIEDIIEKKAGKRMSFEEVIDNHLIAGVIINIGSLIMNGTMSNKLELISQELKKG